MNALRIIFGFLLLVVMAVPVMAQEPTHWNKNMLLVYIPEGNEYTKFMERAFDEWQSKFSRKIQFIKTNFYRDVKLAEIEVQFRQVVGEDAKNSGTTSLSGKTNAYRHGTIVITTKYDEEFENDPAKKAENDEEVYGIMLHQVGKVMGLPDSTNPQSVMYNEVKPGQEILSEDVEKVYSLYGWRARHTQTR